MNFLSVCIIIGLISFSNAFKRPRGVSLEKAQFYDTGSEFRCLASGRAIPMDHVNDDYCDCEDGSDEPGTSACLNGLFYCENKPYTGSYIPSSRVNDGICDCCDGSDEYDGTISCPNTCQELFAEIMAAKAAFRKKQEAGYAVKQEYMQQGKRARDEKLARISELEKAKEPLEDAKTEAEQRKLDAEGPEKEAKDKHEAAWNAIKEEKQKLKDTDSAKAAFAELDVNKDGIVDYPEVQNHLEFDIDSDGEVSVDEAKEYLEEAEETNLETFVEKIWPNIKEIYKKPVAEGEEPKEAPVDPVSEDPLDRDVVEEGSEEYEDEDMDDDDDDDDDFDEDDEDPGKTTEPKGDDEDKMPAYDEETQNLIKVADEARNGFNEADKKVRDAEREIEDIKKYLELDLGPDQEFSALKGQCFEMSDREYTYKLCPFEKTTQRPKSGGIETSLGRWGSWFGPNESRYSAMKYENGQGCWNGPARSTHVNMHCGEVNALTMVSEPSRCEYQFDFTSPALCGAPDKAPEQPVHTEL